MTKQADLDHDSLDRPASLEASERYQRVADQLAQSLKHTHDALTFKELSLSKAYIEGRARIALEFRDVAGGDLHHTFFVSVRYDDGHAGDAKPLASRGITNLEMIDPHDQLGRDQAMVLVSDVEGVDAVKVIPSIFERLDNVEDESDDLGTWSKSRLYMSLQGGFRRHPVLMERKRGPTTDSAAVRDHQSAVCVIEAGSDVMDRIADDGGSVLRQMTSDGPGATVIALGPKAFYVCHHVSPHDGIELLDMMIGPFHLQDRTFEVCSRDV